MSLPGLSEQQQQQSEGGSRQETSSFEAPKDNIRQTAATDLIPVGNIAHPEQCVTLQSRPGQISYLVQAGVYSVTLDEETDAQGNLSRTGQPWVAPNPDFATREAFLTHVECTFLNRVAFRVRLGLQACFPFPDPYPTDADFPPPALRQHLFPPKKATEPIAGDQRDDLVCGLELRADDGDTWVNPRSSGWDLGWQSSPFSLRAYWQKPLLSPDPRVDFELLQSASDTNSTIPNQEENQDIDSSTHLTKPIFEQAPLGPFTPTLLPHGILNLDGMLIGSELLILDVGEKIQSGGLGRHRKESAAEMVGLTDTDPIPKDARGDASTHFGGKFLEEKTKMAPPPFLWSNRGWGILMKNPVAVRIGGLQDGRAMLNLLMLAGENGMIDYIIIVGDALEACRQEYPVE